MGQASGAEGRCARASPGLARTAEVLPRRHEQLALLGPLVHERAEQADHHSLQAVLARVVPGNILWRHARRIQAIHILAVAVQLAVVEEEEGDRGLRPRSVRLRPVPEEPLEPGGARRRLVRQLRLEQADARLEVRPTELLSYPAVQRGVAERDMRGRARVCQLVLGLPGELLVPELLEPRAPRVALQHARRLAVRVRRLQR
mmetsp:Transcript_48634/g.156384  ORF Transcript_48634/g.156384 Transcript_48634/m.156384 type:complete len:202 (-) Transcript_48634:405-1010(-)